MKKTKKKAKKKLSRKVSVEQKRRTTSAARGFARAQPIIAVRDVQASSKWYQELLKAKNLGGRSDHAHMYDRILCDGNLVLQLHSWDDENHPSLTNQGLSPIGHGVVLWFEVEDFEEALHRARKLGAEIIEEPHFNPAPRHFEVWLKDPDGYIVGLASSGGRESP